MRCKGERGKYGEGYLKINSLYKSQMKFQAPIQFQVASLILSPFPFAPHAGAGTRLAA